MAPSEPPALPFYKTNFLKSCLSGNVLTFGTYTLKSGRESPYFFNAGSFHTAPLLSSIATAYAHTIVAFFSSHPSIPKPNVLFGPAYKGISLACSTLLELYRLDPETWSSVSYSFNRKEVKDHGEGGAIVGAPLKGKNVLVLDDVVTAGTAIRETMKLVAAEGGNVIGFVVALDRQETVPESSGIGPASGRTSTLGQIQKDFHVPSTSIVTLDDIISVLKTNGNARDMERLEEYRRKYQANAETAEGIFPKAESTQAAVA